MAPWWRTHRSGPGRRGALGHPQRCPEVVAHGAGLGVAVAGLLGHRDPQHPVDRGGHLAGLRLLRDRGGEVGVDDLVVRRAGVRRVPAHRRPEQATQRVDVAGRAGLPAGVQLGGHVGGCPHGDAGHGQVAVGVDLTGDAEVGEVRAHAVGADPQQHVGGLDVTVHQPRRVRVREPGGDLGDHVDRDAQRRGPAGLDHLPEVAVGHQLGGDVEPAVDLAVGVDVHHVGGVQGRLGLRLPGEPSPEGIVVGEVRRDDLERDLPVELGVQGLEDDAHPAHPEPLAHPVGPISSPGSG